MASTVISAEYGRYRAQTNLYVPDGGVVIPEIEPTVTSFNGVTVDQVLGYGSATLDPFTSNEDLSIVGTNFDRVTGIQIVNGDTAVAWHADYSGINQAHVFVDPSGNLSDGFIVIPSQVPAWYNPPAWQCEYTVTDAQHIVIPALTFKNLATGGSFSDTANGHPDPYFIYGNSFADTVSNQADPDYPLFSYLSHLNGHGMFGEGTTVYASYLDSMWWKLRLWYTSGSHFVEAPLYFRLAIPPPPPGSYVVTTYTGSLNPDALPG
jgi:hypothetical protein